MAPQKKVHNPLGVATPRLKTMLYTEKWLEIQGFANFTSRNFEVSDHMKENSYV